MGGWWTSERKENGIAHGLVFTDTHTILPLMEGLVELRKKKEGENLGVSCDIALSTVWDAFETYA